MKNNNQSRFKKAEAMRVYLRQEDWEKAIVTGEKLLKKHKQALEIVQRKLAQAYRNQGKLYQSQNQLEAAKKIYQQAIKHLNIAEFAYRNLCEILEKQNQWEELKNTALARLQINGDAPWAYLYLMTAYQQLGEDKEYLTTWQNFCTIKGWESCPINNYQLNTETFVDNHLDSLTLMAKNMNQYDNLKILQIGTQDGILTCWLLDNLLTKPQDNITCIDEKFSNLFLSNIQKTKSLATVTQLTGNYSDILKSLPVYAYDIIYLHNENTTINNLTQVSKLLRPYALIILSHKIDNINLEDWEVIDNKPWLLLKKKTILQEGEEISNLRKNVQLYPTAKNYLELGKSLKKYDYLEEAIDCYLTALKIDSYFLETYFDLRFNFLRYKLTQELAPKIFEKVINFCQELLKENPENICLNLILGYSLTQIDNLAMAREYYRQASNQDAQHLKPHISPQSWLTATTQKPHFIVIGAEKCGTTSLYWYLRKHPKIFTSVEKELDFFDREFDKGLDWYLSHFAQVPQDDYYCVGEVSPNYIYHPLAHQRIYDLLPDTKLIVILRNPIERAISRYFMIAKHTKNLAAVTDELKAEVDKIKADYKGDNIGWHRRGGNVGNSLYVYHLKSWLEIFPREQFLILKSEDFYSNPASTMKEIFDYLDLPDYQLDKYPKHNSGNYTPIDADLRAILAEFFAIHNQRLEEFLGMKFDWH